MAAPPVDEYDRVIRHAESETGPVPGRLEGEEEKLVLVMVGLPARGKSYISNKSAQYFSWLGYPAKLFNVGAWRRKSMSDSKQTAEFFSGSNKEAKGQREMLAFHVLDELLRWLDRGGTIAVFDATNTTRSRRAEVLARCLAHNPNYNVIFVESICDKPEVLQSNLDQKVRHSPDYRDMTYEDALADLKMRIENYNKVYEPVDDDDMSYIKMINLQSKVICNRIHGALAHMLVAFVMSVHIVPRPIFLCRAGDFEGDLWKRPSGVEEVNFQSFRQLPIGPMNEDSPMAKKDLPPVAMRDTLHLSDKGRLFATRLAEVVKGRLATLKREGRILDDSLIAHTSTLSRAVETCSQLSVVAAKQWSALNMLDTGICHGMDNEEMESKFPAEYRHWKTDPLHYRLPGGESLQDMVKRMGPFVIEMERQTNPAIIVSHHAPLRFLYGYFMNITPTECSSLNIPRHTVIELLPTQYGWVEKRYDLSDGEAMNVSSATDVLLGTQPLVKAAGVEVNVTMDPETL